MQVPLISVDLWCACTTIQAALAIRGLGVRGFDYLRSRITRENRHFGAELGLNYRFWYSRFEIYQERNPRE